MARSVTLPLIVLIIVTCSVSGYAAQDNRFPQSPAEFLADASNSMLRAGIEENAQAVRDLEKAASASGGFRNSDALTDYAVALLAIGQVKEAEGQISLAENQSSGDSRRLQLVRLVKSLVLVRDGQFAVASRVLDSACSVDNEVQKRVCRLLAAEEAGLSGDRRLSLTAVKQLHQDVGIVAFPNTLIPKEAAWDALRVANYAVMKHFDAGLWASYEQDWQRIRVRGRYVNTYDFVLHAKSSDGAWQSLEQLVKFEFTLGNYTSVLNWISEYKTQALAHDWQLATEQYGYAARAYFLMGKQDDAELQIKEAQTWIEETSQDKKSRNLVWLDFLDTFNVEGLEQIANYRLDDIWQYSSGLNDLESQLIAFEAGFKLMQNYSRTADLAKFEQLRQQVQPLALRIENKIPRLWPGKRFNSSWLDLLVAETILKYDPRTERLAAAAANLDRDLVTAKRYVDLTRQNGRAKAGELKRPVDSNDTSSNTSKQIQRAASELEQELIPTLGRIYIELRAWSKAIPLLESAYILSMQESVCGRPTEQVTISIQLWQIAQQLKNEAGIKSWKEETQACLLAWDDKSPLFAELLAQEANEYSGKGDFFAAESALARAIWIQRQFERPSDRTLAAYLQQYAELVQREDDGQYSTNLMKESGEIISAVDRQDWTPQERGFTERQIAAYAGLANNARSKLDKDRILDVAFRTSQRWLNNDAGRAVEALARRHQIADEKLVSLVQKRDELLYQRSLQDRRFGSLVGTSNASEVVQVRQKIAGEISDLDEAIKKINSTIADSGNTLLAPPIMSISEVQRSLSEDETLIYFVFGSNQIVRWTIGKKRVASDHLPATADEVSQMIAKVRCGVDTSAWSIDVRLNKRICADRVLPNSSTFSVLDVPFDLPAAWNLYNALFAGMENDSMPNWTIVSSGALSSLSFSVLVAELSVNHDESSAAYGEVKWLALAHALDFLPDISSVRSLRSEPSKAKLTYVGFGNPVSPGQSKLTQISSCNDPHQLNFCPGLAPNTAMLGGGRSAHVSDSSLAPIPQTACELCKVGEYLHLNAQERSENIHLGKNMTRTAVKGLGTPNAQSGRSELQQYRIVHFATHGIMAGEVSQVAEPGLVMSVPENAPQEKLQDTILTAGDVAELKLDAEWVILSACNTAASNQPGGEAFSGLARAFLYAGARSVLVSHWSVFTDAAVMISISAIRALTIDQKLTRGQALRAAILENFRQGKEEHKSDKKSDKLHPAYWGPFALIGAMQ